MTRNYNGEYFREPQFLVFCNRVGALIVASICLSLMGKRGEDSSSETRPPLTSYAHPALSNIISSWCQYEALIFITFPVQVSWLFLCYLPFSLNRNFAPSGFRQVVFLSR